MFPRYRNDIDKNELDRAKLIEIMNHNLVSLNLIDKNKIVAIGSGYALGDHHVLTVAHALMAGCSTCVNNFKKAGIVHYCDYKNDIAVLKFPDINIPEPIFLGISKAKVGSRIFTISNSIYTEAKYLYDEFVVSFVDKNNILIRPANVFGSSGAIFYDASGSIVGIGGHEALCDGNNTEEFGVITPVRLFWNVLKTLKISKI